MAYRLKKTCSVCPEAYDVYRDDVLIGSMRLRHGSFTALYRRDVVYSAYTQGDGCFDDEAERQYHLNEGLAAIEKAIPQSSKKMDFAIE